VRDAVTQAPRLPEHGQDSVGHHRHIPEPGTGAMIRHRVGGTNACWAPAG